MLIRRYGKKQEVAMDPWEAIDCGPKIAEAFMQTDTILPLSWNGTAVSSPVGRDNGKIVRITEDQVLALLRGGEVECIYFRQPIDIARYHQHLQDPTFFVNAESW